MTESKKRDGAECEVLCKTCVLWVSDDGEDGFCLARDLFTHTKCSYCPDRIEGDYMKETEWEEFQYGEKL